MSNKQMQVASLPLKNPQTTKNNPSIKKQKMVLNIISHLVKHNPYLNKHKE
jgi:hypothetical protein